MQEFEQTVLYRERRYSVNGRWFSWYEPCPILKHSPKFITVISQTFAGSSLYPGGTFKLRRSSLIATGKCYHSRHGEYFFLTQPEQGALFPSDDVLTVKPAIELEAKALGWNLQALTTLQLQAYIFAIKTGCTLSQAYG